MKTNQILTRENSAFVQRTKDGYFDANRLLNAWNTSNGGKPKQLSNYNATKSTKDFKEQLKKEGVEKPMMTTRGYQSSTWMHPKLFIDFAMWVSVEFKSIVIDYVLDGLIKSRNTAGDYYNEMTAAILDTHIKHFGTRPNPKLYKEEAVRVKELLGLGYKDRNDMTEQDLNNITMMQKLNTMLLENNVGKISRIKQLKFQAELLKR